MFRNLFNQNKQTTTLPKIESITPNELKERLDAGDPLLLVDVRTPGEYQHDGHIANSQLLPLSALGQRLDELPTDQTIVFICRSGNRSMVACQQLAQIGFENTINLSSGMIGWQMAGFPIQ